jgi:hypothetical protein
MKAVGGKIYLALWTGRWSLGSREWQSKPEEMVENGLRNKEANICETYYFGDKDIFETNLIYYVLS